MEKQRILNIQELYISKMTKQLPVLRASIKVTQKDLATKLGVTRQSMMNIETGRHPMKWTTYLALILIFQQFVESRALLDNLGLFNEDVLEIVI